MQTLFDKFDRDGGGTIDLHELGDALREMGKEPTPGDLATLMKEADRDGSGQLSFEEVSSRPLPSALRLSRTRRPRVSDARGALAACGSFVASLARR